MGEITPTRVRITGKHPWAGFTGVALAIEKPSIGILEPMARVRLDDGQDCPYQHECYVGKGELVVLQVAVDPETGAKERKDG